MFIKYPHLERLGNQAVLGITDAPFVIQPKLDGSNCSVWMEEGQLCAASRNRKLTLEKDHAGFLKYVLENEEEFKEFFALLKRLGYGEARFYGEWLIPHTIKTYQEDAWKKFYIFDITSTQSGREVYTWPSDVEIYSDTYNFEPTSFSLVPSIYVSPKSISLDINDLLEYYLKHNTYKMQEGHVGEGIVLKSPTFVNRFGETTFAKIIHPEYKNKGDKSTEIPTFTKGIEFEIACEFVDKHLVEKEYDKLAVDGWESKMIPRLLNTVYHCFITEELWDALKKKKSPTLDFKILQKEVYHRVREIKPEIF